MSTHVGPSLSSPFATSSALSATVIRRSFRRRNCRVGKIRGGFSRRVAEHHHQLGHVRALVKRASTVGAALLWELRRVLGRPQAQATPRPGSSRWCNAIRLYDHPKKHYQVRTWHNCSPTWYDILNLSLGTRAAIFLYKCGRLLCVG